MHLTRQKLEDAELRRLARVKSAPPPMPDALGPELISFFKTSVQKRQTKLEKIAGGWAQLVPEVLHDHCAREGFTRGTLTVLVGSASHLYELNKLLLPSLVSPVRASCQ